jgi:hypothetical protein
MPRGPWHATVLARLGRRFQRLESNSLPVGGRGILQGVGEIHANTGPHVWIFFDRVDLERMTK